MTDERLHELLAPVGLSNWGAACRAWERLIGYAATCPAFAARLTALPPILAASANPDQALLNLERLLQGAPDRRALLQSLAGEPRLIETLVTLFAGSQFLGEILLRRLECLRWLGDPRQLTKAKGAAQFNGEAQEALEGLTGGDDQLAALRHYQRGELLRIGAGDLLGLLDLPAVTAQLSSLADSMVSGCLDMAARQTGASTEGLAVIALGKLGGQELNYSSDIDLLFVAAANAPAYNRLCERLIDALARATAEGFLYRVDLRLRPWGQAGALVPSLDGHLRYLRRHARLWEKQALLKARVIAGDVAVGSEFLRQAEPLLFETADAVIRADVREMKRRIEVQLSRRGKDWGEVKLGKGSIRDVEFVVQYLQLAHGARHPEVRSHNTLEALARLQASGLLSADDRRTLAEGYTFLRPVEHYLQLMHHQQTHSLPGDPRELGQVAQRLGFKGAEPGARFLAHYQQHAAAIRAVYQRHLEGEDVDRSSAPQSPSPAPDVGRHVARMAPSYAATFDEAEIRQHAAMAERLDDSNLVEVDAVPLGSASWRLTVVGYDYPGELSLICGLLFVYGFSIGDGHVFTYEPSANNSHLIAAAPDPRGRPGGPHTSSAERQRGAWHTHPTQQNSCGKPLGAQARAIGGSSRRKIVDVFSVRSVLGEGSQDLWSHYAGDLAGLLRRLQAGQLREAQGELAKRVAVSLRDIAGATATLYPIDIEIDNDVSDRYTVLYIDAPDTIGFLYEFTNALSLRGIYIARVSVESVGSRVRDVVYLTDAHGRKIASPERQQELRAATVLVKHFTHLLPQSPNPETALLHFGELLEQLFRRPDWAAELASLERPEVLSALARLLGVSDFLWDDFLRMQHANLFPIVRDVGALAAAKPKEQLQSELEAALRAASDGAARRIALNAFKDREMFRVDMRHIQAPSPDLDLFSSELTDLAEVVVDGAYRLCEEELRARFGAPSREGSGPCRLCICALGKCGGRELGFASDIELMFIFDSGGRAAGPEAITAAEYYEELVRRFTAAIQARRAGIFEVDLRLRPYGNAGSLAVSLDSFRRYFGPDGAAWPYERQALIKLRPIAGDRDLGDRVASLRDRFVYTGEPFDAAAMRAMRERQIRHHVAGGTINAKYSPGGRVDVEYLVQALQISHGHREPGLRLTNTGEALAALAASGILSPGDHARLREAYAFLRQLTDALRMVRGNAKDLSVPPADSEEFAFLARRLRYESDPARLRADLTRHTRAVQELGERLLAGDGHARQPPG